MAKGGEYSDNFDEGSSLAYDLRSIYAKMIEKILNQLLMAKLSKDFQAQYDMLDILHTEINHKLKAEQRKEYVTKLKKCNHILSQNSAAFTGKRTNYMEVANVKMALKEMEMWLKDMMEKHKMWGAKEEEEEGL